ncbi:MAG: UbiA family prenyltransferase [Alphaproteobacteria bacterium]|nr:UbiA family prenyltransferase [Alphaproteobacteria bacterium]
MSIEETIKGVPLRDRWTALVGDYVRIARFDHWVKNIFVLPGIALAMLLKPDYAHFDFLAFVIALLATGFTASANYVINEYLDAEFDRHHPIKSKRPGAQGRLEARFVALEYVLLAGLGLGLAALINTPFLLTAVCLLAMGIIYNVRPLRSKDRAYADVLTEAVNNAIRLLLGWYTLDGIGIPPSSVILAYWMGGAYLMAIKRYAEYREIADPARAGLYRRSFAHYSERSLLLSSFFYALNSVLFLGIFLVKYNVEYVLAFPLVAWLFVFYFHLGTKPRSTAQAPEKLYRERKLMLLVTAVVVAFVVLTFVDIPFMQDLVEPVHYP